MTFVPTVELNGKQRNQKQLLRRLKRNICKLYKVSTNAALILFLDGRFLYKQSFPE